MQMNSNEHWGYAYEYSREVIGSDRLGIYSRLKTIYTAKAIAVLLYGIS